MIVVILAVKVVLLSRAFAEIDEQVKDHLDGTNSSSFHLSSGDKNARKLANDLNDELQELHKERVFLRDGDKRMKENVTAISHDLRTPLTAINSYVDMLVNEKPHSIDSGNSSAIGNELIEPYFIQKERETKQLMIPEVCDTTAFCRVNGIADEVAAADESVYSHIIVDSHDDSVYPPEEQQG